MKIYTDGSADNIKRTGGWGVYVLDRDERWSGYENDTTSNRMEMYALYRALKICLDTPGEHVILTDSQYCKKGYTEWLKGWHNKNYQNIKNSDLWRWIWELKNELKDRVRIFWVKGHAGDYGNEEVNKIAIEARTKFITCNGNKEKDIVRLNVANIINASYEVEHIGDIEIGKHKGYLTLKQNKRMIKITNEQFKQLLEKYGSES